MFCIICSLLFSSVSGCAAAPVFCCAGIIFCFSAAVVSSGVFLRKSFHQQWFSLGVVSSGTGSVSGSVSFSVSSSVGASVSSSVSSCIVSVRKILEWIEMEATVSDELLLSVSSAVSPASSEESPLSDASSPWSSLSEPVSSEFSLSEVFSSWFSSGVFSEASFSSSVSGFSSLSDPCFLCWNYLRQNHLREIYPHHHFSCIRSFRLFYFFCFGVNL